MPPKRDAGATPTQPPVKMIKIGTDAQEFGGDPVEDKYRLAEESNYSPFPNNEVRDFDLILHTKQMLFTSLHMQTGQLISSHLFSMKPLILMRKMCQVQASEQTPSASS